MSLKHQPRRKTDSKPGGLAREGGAGCTIQALSGENNEVFIEEGRWRVGRLAGTVWYAECPLASWEDRALGCGMGQFGTQCPLASGGGRELGDGVGQVGTQCVPWPAGRTGKWDLGCEMGQVLSVPWPAGGKGSWDVGCGMGQSGTQSVP